MRPVSDLLLRRFSARGRSTPKTAIARADFALCIGVLCFQSQRHAHRSWRKLRRDASVVEINPAENQLVVGKASGELATYDPRRLTGVSVYREIEREFSVGDRIQFTAPDKLLGVANRDLAVIESVAPDGCINAHLENHRQIEFNASQNRHFDHGYAVTSHSSQGLTAERVLVHADTSVHPDLLNSRFGYVSISRASHRATLFTDDIAKLGPQLGADISKTSALEINRNLSIAQGTREWG